jgi:hypothetical protein
MWSTDTFSHVRQAVAVLAYRVQAVQALLALGPEVADPKTVHDAGQALEEALEGFWGPVAWDHVREDLQ